MTDSWFFVILRTLVLASTSSIHFYLFVSVYSLLNYEYHREEAWWSWGAIAQAFCTVAMLLCFAWGCNNRKDFKAAAQCTKHNLRVSLPLGTETLFQIGTRTQHGTRLPTYKSKKYSKVESTRPQHWSSKAPVVKHTSLCYARMAQQDSPYLQIDWIIRKIDR